MKTTKCLLSMMSLTVAIYLLGSGITITAQENAAADYYTFSGVVKDMRSKKAIEQAAVSALGTNIGTVTNEDGEFTLKISNALNVSEIRLSCVGYYNALVSIKKNNKERQTLYLTPESYHLNEVQVLSWKNPRDLIEAAIDKIEKNYRMQPDMLTGFYRETVQKRRRFINISEAVIEVYKSPYDLSADDDQVKILKGRKLISPKLSDTLSVKLLGGPNMPVYLDVVKNRGVLLDKETLPYYAYKMDESTSIDDRLQYVIHFEPAMIVPFPLYRGTFYIDRETLSFTRAEFNMDMSDKRKVTDVILKNKPSGLRFTPEEVSYTIVYKQQNDKTHLNYIRNEIKFKCDWKRRLFATNYVVSGEAVITDRNDRDVKRMPYRETFTQYRSLSQEVGLYQDENFWSNYNIIEPTESLENAVGKLKKQILKQ